MRLLVVTQYFWPENFRVNDMATELVARGHEVTVLTGLPNYPEGRVFPDYRADPQRFAAFEGVTIHRVPILPRGTGGLRLILNYLSFVLSASTLGLWKLRGRRFDAIFVFQLSPITSALPAILLRRVKRAPLLMWVLDLWPETLAAIGVVRSKRLLALIGKMVRFIYRRCDRILVQSRAFVDHARAYGARPEQILYFPGWPEAVFLGAQEEAGGPAEFAAYAGDFRILFAGNIGETQDFPAILDAAEALRDVTGVRLLIVGDGRAAPMVRREIERRGLEERMIMLGRYPLERMPAFFGAADALLVSLGDQPAWSMTIPGKVQSYLSAGKPLLGMMNGEGARVIAESGAGLVAPAGDGRALAASIRAMTALPPEERARMGRLGQDYCAREFNRSRLLDAFETWVAELRQEALPS